MLGASFFIWKEYTSFLGRESRELSELIAFVKNTRERMKCYLEPPSAWIAAYSTPELERVGFFTEMREGRDIEAAYIASAENMCVDDDVKSAFSTMISEMGEGYLESEISAIDAALDKLCAIEKRVANDFHNKNRAAGAMLAAITVGVIILVI